MKRAILSSIAGWAAGVVFLMGYSLLRPRELWSAEPLDDFLRGSMISAYFVAIVAFPTCLFIVAPLLILLPRGSTLWRPPVATILGAVVAPFTLHLWAMGYLRRIFAPEFHDGTHVAFGCAAACVGAVFAYCYATSIRNVRNA
jgi:hypothetical protein